MFPNLGEKNTSRPESQAQVEIPLCPQCQIYRAQRTFEANQSTWLSFFYSSSSIIYLEQSLRTVLCSKGNKTISSICLTYVQRAVAKSFAWLDLKSSLTPFCSQAWCFLDPELLCTLPLRPGSASWLPVTQCLILIANISSNY